jgi:molybdate transport system ATP-binding protein
VARALARRPGVLLLDEPLSALDARTRAAAAHQLAAVLREIDIPSLLVTHDFSEAAQLGDRVGVIDAGRVVQEGTPSELAATPRSAFVADFTGAVVLSGMAGEGPDGLTRVRLDGGGEAISTDRAEGPVAVSVYPWEITIEPAGETAVGSAQNRLAAEVISITTVGNRVRVGLAAPQPLAAEITESSARNLELRTGTRVTATWKAAATRLLNL